MARYGHSAYDIIRPANDVVGKTAEACGRMGLAAVQTVTVQTEAEQTGFSLLPLLCGHD